MAARSQAGGDIVGSSRSTVARCRQWRALFGGAPSPPRSACERVVRRGACAAPGGGPTRRRGGERRQDGAWVIADDHLVRAEAYEARVARDRAVRDAGFGREVKGAGASPAVANRPAQPERRACNRELRARRLQLFSESADRELISYPDNIFVTPRSDTAKVERRDLISGR